MRLRALAALASLVTSLTFAAPAGPAQAATSGLTASIYDADISNMGPNGNFAPFHVLDVEGWSVSDRGRVHMWDYLDSGNVLNQRWDIVVVPGTSVFEVKNENSGKCLDKSMDNGDVNGALVYQYTCSGAHNQLWYFDDFSRWYRIRSLEDGRCLDIRDKNPNTDATVQVWSCNGAWNQTWFAAPD